jgi:prolyl oligopeptidase
MPIGTLTHEPAVDILHGVTVVDPFRWLEDRNSPETQEWIATQQEIHNRYFSALSNLDPLSARVREYLNVDVVEQPTQIGQQVFFRRRRKDEEQSSLWVQDARTGVERVLVDPSPEGPFTAVTIHRISEDGTLLAYEHRNGGEKPAAIHFIDVESGQTLEDHLFAGYPRGLVFASDNIGVYFCHETPTDIEDSQPHEIRYHRMGSPATLDRVLLSLPRQAGSRMVLLSDEQNLGAVLAHAVNDEMKIDLYRASRSADTRWTAVFVERTAPYGPIFRNGQMYVYSNDGAPNGHILALSDDGREGRVIVPAWKVPIYGLHIFRNRIFVTYLIDLESVVRIWSFEGTFLGTMPTPKDGSFALLRGYSDSSDALFSTYESFHQLPVILRFDERGNENRPWTQSYSAAAHDRFEVRRTTYPSKDGTTVPMFLVAFRGAGTAAARPAILTAYGGFGMCMTPRFSVLVAVLLELGAVFALPNIRGGAEFGKDWHDAARGRRRQAAYDDFIAAAEWLCAERITSPQRLGIFGGSNSGLLVGAAMTQRPDLFQAVLCLAPILDMVRYERFGDARKWRNEYGTVDNLEEFNALYAYSPYHHVSETLDYPATLFVCGDKDSVCDPAHSRKMAARLQERGAQCNPILVDYSAERGHTAVLPLSMRVEALARRVAFLCNQLGITIPNGDVS